MIRYIINFSVFFLILFLFSNSSFSQNVEQLKKEAKFTDNPELWYELGLIYQKGELEKVNLKKAAHYYEKAAVKGHVEASFHLAGLKVAKNEYGSAIKLYTIAADGGSIESAYLLGKFYKDGTKVTKDNNLSIHYFLKSWDVNYKDSKDQLDALDTKNYNKKESDILYQKYLAQNGSAKSEYDLGIAYKKGTDVKQDLEKSFNLFSNSAANGYGPAQYELGLFYKNGLLGRKDSQKAVEFFVKASNNGIREAAKELEKMDVKTFIKDDDIEFIKYQAITNNNAIAQYELYKYYEAPKSETQDMMKAVEFCQRSALQDYTPAMLALSDLYLKGDTLIKKNDSSAFKWRRQAAFVGSDSAEYLLGNMYKQGVGVPKSDEKAVRWYLKAANHGIQSAADTLKTMNINQYLNKSDLEYATFSANQGDIEAQMMLGRYYFKNDKAPAIVWLQKASLQNNAEAELLLGDIYKEGKCQTVANPSTAEIHYKKAIALGNQEAYLKMADLYTKGNVAEGVDGTSSTTEAMAYANTYMTQASNLNSENTNADPKAFLLMGDILNSQGKTIDAIKQYDLYIKSFDEVDGNHQEFITVMNKQAIAYAEIGEVNSALLQIEIALAKADDFSMLKDFKDNYSAIKGELFYTQGKLLFQQGDKYKACGVFQKVKALGIKLDPKYENLCSN
ncbi:sel1 repeat family protein [Flammeovirga pectinis]|uniref:Sel1 repeat family protein n=1 Tax=Flammeovirga pectinis TaxID=2494373 RepID=A0A3Q9FMT0_9BACT|nr:tetratricopeptide repeat protein [Flammeovirga pectinis]AZQ62245.1 sel1 repeat family protein [Flammeovirga pectinis]